MPVTVHEFSRRPNVHFLPLKSQVELAAYPQHFDVCVMPYTLDRYSRSTYPLKLHEYFASGRPVVSTPIEAVRFDWDDIVRRLAALILNGLEERSGRAQGRPRNSRSA